MHLVVYLPLLGPVLAAIAARPLAERLPPATATWLLSVSALLLAAGSSAVTHDPATTDAQGIARERPGGSGRRNGR